jgi:predicted DNA-binding protein (MmcQ/YjbR family)
MNAEALRSYCLSFPEVTEEVKWENHLCFLIRQKMFCVYCLEAPFRVSFKVLPDEWEPLLQRNHIIPAPYLARYHWVQGQDENALTDTEWKHYLKQSYALVAAATNKKSSYNKKK